MTIKSLTHMNNSKKNQKMQRSRRLFIKKKQIASKIIYCDSIFMQGTGLMMKPKSSVKNTAWLFKLRRARKTGITMFMVFFPIDIICMDKDNKIIELVRNLKPFSRYNTEEKISSFIELESGSIKKHSIKLKDKIILK